MYSAKKDYDDLDRLLSAHYTCNTGTEGDGRYDEVMNYDDNGNILSLERSGKVDEGSYGVLDKLSLAYESTGSCLSPMMPLVS